MSNETDRTLEVVAKITERCNINCSYCYIFNKGDDSFKGHPPYMAQDVIEALADFLEGAAITTKASKIVFIIHGGEPLMMKKQRFDKMCTTLRDKISSFRSLKLVVQTNAMLIDSEWIDIFDKHQIAVGVSLDGPREENDLQRVDHSGKGTYDRVVSGLTRLKNARDEGLIPGLGILSVVNPRLSGKAAYRHIVDELRIDAFDFLLPIDPHDGFDLGTVPGYGQFLCDVFDEWVKDDDPGISIRIINQAVSFLRDGHQIMQQIQHGFQDQHAAFTVSSNGDLGPDDTLRTINRNLFGIHNVQSSTYDQFIGNISQQAISLSETTLPKDCLSCAWKNMCRGGAANGRLINRFSLENGFNNSSVVCEALKQFYSHVAAYLLRVGLDFDKLTNSLLQTEINWNEYTIPCPFSNRQPLGNLKSKVSIPIVLQD
jgi:uncharacterized protein